MNIRAWSRFVYRVLSQNFAPTTLPFKYFLVVTKSCGSRCANCFIWKETPEHELTLPEFDRLARTSAENLLWLNV